MNKIYQSQGKTKGTMTQIRDIKLEILQR